MTRKECLKQAMGCVLKDRNNEYGEPENSFDLIADLWTAYTGHVFIGSDVAAMMALLKLARLKRNARHLDSAVDLAGYAACFAECASAETAHPVPFAPKAECSCCQNGNDHSPEASAEPDFKPGDKVQFCQFPHADVWFDGIVERVEGGHCFIRRSNGVEVSAPKRLIRRPCAEGCEKPKFKAGDKVQIRVTLPSVSDRIWVDGTYARYDRGYAFPHAVYNDAGHEENVQEEDIRPSPKAEGVEELVQKDAPLCGERCEEFIPGLGTCEGCHHAREKDAPQTKKELMQRIVDSNPSVYPRTPTGEELAEMAEEEKRG